MPWAALDDQFHANPKVVSAGLAGAGLYAMSISYCAAYLTDGFVPARWARQVSTRKVIEKVIVSGLWIEVEGGYRLDDYLSFNPSKTEVLKKRAEAAERKRKSRERQGDVTGQVTASVTRDNPQGHAVSHAGPRAPARTPPLQEPKDLEDEKRFKSQLHEIQTMSHQIGRTM